MNLSGKIAICLAGGLALQASARALTSDDNLYATIVKKNVFRLKSPSQKTRPTPAVPPPKITLLGIVCGFGSKQVMCKSLSGMPPKETNYVLHEGQRAGEIEVIEINESTGTVRVKNHGQQQLLSLEKDGMKPGGTGGFNASRAATVSGSVGETYANRKAAIQNPKSEMTAEEQMIIMEINRELTADQVRQGLLPPLPSTPLTGN